MVVCRLPTRSGSRTIRNLTELPLARSSLTPQRLEIQVDGLSPDLRMGYALSFDRHQKEASRVIRPCGLFPDSTPQERYLNTPVPVMATAGSSTSERAVRSRSPSRTRNWPTQMGYTFKHRKAKELIPGKLQSSRRDPWIRKNLIEEDS